MSKMCIPNAQQVCSIVISTFAHWWRLKDIATASIYHEFGSVELHHPALGLVV